MVSAVGGRSAGLVYMCEGVCVCAWMLGLMHTRIEAGRVGEVMCRMDGWV